MKEIIVIKFSLIILGFGLIYYLLSRGDKLKRWDEIYGNIKSIQLIVLLIVLLMLIAFLVADFFSFSIFEFFVGNLSKLPKSTIETYFSSLVNGVIGFVGFIGIVITILYGSYYIKYEDKKHAEIKKLKIQCRIWLFLIIYFTVVMYILFIQPLIDQLGK